MLFKPTTHLIAILTLLGSSCGIMGQRDDYKKLVEVASGKLGCLNNLGGQIKRFSKGEIEEQEWANSWGCANEMLDLFTTFVRPSEPEGYNYTDIELLIENFIVTDQAISEDLIRYGFKLKASLFGGTEKHILKEEVAQIAALIRSVKSETTPLIRHLYNFHNRPTSKNMIDLADAFRMASKRIGRSLSTEDNLGLSRQSLHQIILEVSQLYGAEFPKEFSSLFMAVKNFLVSGGLDEIKNGEWQRTFNVAGSFLGILLAFQSLSMDDLKGPNEYGVFLNELVQRAGSVLGYALEKHDGEIDLTVLDQVIRNIPEEWMSLNKDVLVYTLRPLVNRIMTTSKEGALTEESIRTVTTKFDRWTRAKTFLERIFAEFDIPPEVGPTKLEFLDYTLRFREKHSNDLTEEDLELLLTLDWMVETYPSLMKGNSTRLVFEKNLPYPLVFLKQTLWMAMLGGHLLEAYEDHPTLPARVSEEGFKVLFDDIEPLLFELQIFDSTAVDLYKKRFGEADLFNIKSNGDGYIDIEEFAIYGSYLLSITALTRDIRQIFEPICTCSTGDPLDPFKPGCQGWGLETPTDPLGWEWMDMQCFRDEYFGRIETLWEQFPVGVNYYNNLDHAEQLQVQHAIEGSARRYGVDDRPIGSYDALRYAGIVHYVESVYFRFDQNRSGRLNTDEILKAFPVFRKIISDIANIDRSEKKKLEAVFTFLVDKGKKPKRDFWGKVDFLFWMLKRPCWDIKAKRNQIYQVTSIFNEPELPPEIQ